jgi:methionyl aminopeptidase
MITLKTTHEIELLRKSSLLVGKTLGEVAKVIRAGITSKEIDKLAEDFILSNGAKPGFKGYNGYPATLCISINDQVVHGIPDNTLLKDGDIVSVDCGVLLDGYYGDYAYTFEIGEVSEVKRELVKRTKESLYKGIEQAVDGNRIGDIGNAVQQHVEYYGFSVVRELVGHGIGKHLHEKPEVYNYGRKGTGIQLKEGMVICIEPMINIGRRNIIEMDDGWTIKTRDGKASAHFEHMVLVRKGEAEVISTYDYIEENLK